MNYLNVIALHVDVVFPAGVAIGGSSFGNHLNIDKNGMDKPVIRGTSIAGILRHTYSEQFSIEESNYIFGCINESEGEAKESKVHFFDSILEIGEAAAVIDRTHISVDRHWSKVSKGALFSFSATPPNSNSELLIQIYDDNEDNLLREAKRLASLFSLGLILGGNSNRGIGLMKLKRPIKYTLYNLQDVEDFSSFLDNKRAWKQNDFSSFNQSKSMNGDLLSENLLIDVSFSIPEGQDLLIGNMNGAMKPEVVLAADGKVYWQLPGASVRGVIKSFITGLAARNGKLITDTFINSKNVSEKNLSAQKGWLFEEPDEGARRNPLLHKKYTVASLFGSLHAAGRIHITDSFVPFNDKDVQNRTHVAVDSITGGAIEGMLFSNEVLISDTNSASKFITSIIIKNPKKHEIKWLVSALKAIDSGFLRLGSSKASGRLEIINEPSVEGKLKTEFIQIWKEMSK